MNNLRWSFKCLGRVRMIERYVGSKQPVIDSLWIGRTPEGISICFQRFNLTLDSTHLFHNFWRSGTKNDCGISRSLGPSSARRPMPKNNTKNSPDQGGKIQLSPYKISKVCQHQQTDQIRNVSNLLRFVWDGRKTRIVRCTNFF